MHEKYKIESGRKEGKQTSGNDNSKIGRT